VGDARLGKVYSIQNVEKTSTICSFYPARELAAYIWGMYKAFEVYGADDILVDDDFQFDIMKPDIYQSNTIAEMIEGLESWAQEKEIDLTNKIPDNVNNLDELFQDGGEARCEHFTDLAWGYALQFGEIDDYKNDNGFESHRNICIDKAMKKLQKKYNKS
jgi:hypothetical protein